MSKEKNKKTGSPKYPLDPLTLQRLFELRQDISAIKSAEKSFLALLVQCPISVKLKTFQLQQSKELQHLLTTAWQEWHKQLYIWLNWVGVLPYYFRKIRGTIHSRPVVPPYNSGYISISLNDNHEVEYFWTWYQAKENENIKFYFVTAMYPPTADGLIQVPLVSLLRPYDLLKKAELAAETAWYAQSHPQHILEYKPTAASLNEMNVYRTFHTGETMMGVSPEKIAEMRTVKIRNATESIRRTIAFNNRQKLLPRDAVTAQEKQKEWEKRNAALLDHVIPLDPDFQYKSVPPPKVDADIMELRLRLEQQAAMLMDFPVEAINAGRSSQRLKAQSENELRFLNERVKMWINILEKETVTSMLIIYNDFIQETLDSVVKLSNSERRLLAPAELKVEMQCTPLTTWDELVKYADYGIMTKDDFAVHAFKLKALPLTQIHVEKEQQALEPKSKKKK